MLDVNDAWMGDHPCISCAVWGINVAFHLHNRQVQNAGHRSQVAGRRSQVAGRRSQVPGRRSQVPGPRSQVPGPRSQVAGRRSQVAGRRSQVTGHRKFNKKVRYLIRLFMFICFFHFRLRHDQAYVCHRPCFPVLF